MELDAVNFTDECFDSYISIRPAKAAADNSNAGRRKVKDAEVLTDELYYRDADTNTKFKKNEV